MGRTAGPILVCAFFVAVLITGGLIGSFYPQSQQQSSEHWLTKDASGFFTFVLVIVAVFQAAMFGWQLVYMRRSLEDTGVAARAAKSAAQAAVLQARAAVAQSQPLIAFAEPQIEFWHGKQTLLKLSNPGDLMSGVYATVNLHNAGGGPARLRSATADWFLGGELPLVPFRGSYIPQFHILKKDSSLTLNFKASAFWLSESQLRHIEEGSANLWFYGAIRFDDVLGETFEQGFVAHWEEKPTNGRSKGRGLIVEGPPAYNALIPIEREQG